MKRLTYSKSLVENWCEALIATYKYERHMDLIVQPTFGKKVLSYVPLLDYTDRTSDNIKDLKELAKDNHYLFRTLNFDYQEFKDHDPVTMRIDIEGKSIDDIYANYTKQTRRRIRKARNSNKYNAEILYGSKGAQALYQVTKDIFDRHGTPMLPKSLFENLLNYVGGEVHIIYSDNKLAGACYVFYNNQIATLKYGGIIASLRDNMIGTYFDHLIFDHIITNHKDLAIIDMGRSPYNQGTFIYKDRLGALPVKIDLIQDTPPKDIYETYEFASKIWRLTPNFITDKIGPKLTKYLVDL